MRVRFDGIRMIHVMALGHVCRGILWLITRSSEAAGGRDAATAEGGPAAPW